MFQFLLGRLETLQNYTVVCLVIPFQFLLGRLETLQNYTVVCLVIPFQFLLGRLETYYPDKFRELQEVSIPLR